MSMPLPVKPEITQFSTFKVLPARNLIPLIPVKAPLIDRLRRVMALVLVVSLTMTPLTPAERIPARFESPSIVIPLLIVTAPKPPESSASISPPSAVFETAPAKVLQGAVRLHGLASSPTPDTQVRVACAWAMDAKANVKIAIAITLIVNRNLFIWSLLFSVEVWGWPPVEHGSVPATAAPNLPIVD